VTENHRRARIQKLPDNSDIFQPPSDRAVRVDQASDLHKVDPVLADDPPDSVYLGPEASSEPKMRRWICRSTHAVERHGYHVDARSL
jgi:hypothetical protein